MYNEEVRKKLYAYFQQKLGMVHGHNGWLVGTCPYCHKDRKLGVHIKNRRTNCFVCGGLKRPFYLLMDLEGFETFTETYNYLKAFKHTDYLGFVQLERDPEEVKKIKMKMVLPEGYKLLSFGDNIVARSARNVLSKRGFNIMNLTLAGVGYCDKPKSKFFGYIIIPYYIQGKLVYFTARKIFDIGTKFMNPTSEEMGIGKSILIYNVDALAIYKEVHLVESATNALTLGPRAIGLGGKTISLSQYSAIIRSPVETVNLFLDPDALKEAYTLTLDLSIHKKIRVIELPDNKDVNETGKKLALQLKKESPILTYNQCLIKYHDKKTNYTHR